MRNRISILSILFHSAFSIYAQTYFGSQNVIADIQTDGANSVYAADIDGDGDMDVLSASAGDDKIAWYENTDGNGTFGSQQIITVAANIARSVYAIDIDCDGDIDVLSASQDDNKIAWYENTDGNGTFGPQQVITLLAGWAQSVYSTDLDGDGDMDVLSASNRDNKISWYENINCNGTFGAQQTITNSANYANSVYATDIDGDGDMDVLSASKGDDKIAWYENTDRNGTFGPPEVITTSALDALSVFSADIDGDGDADVVSGSYGDDKVAWYENIDGSGTFGPQQVITTFANGPQAVYAADFNEDGFIDVVSASRDDDKIAWYENTDGKGTFGVQQIITTSADGAWSVFSIDLDGDGDSDVISASILDDKIAWYENFTLRIISQPQDQVVCPNSTTDFVIDAKDADTYRWQVNEGSGFIYLTNSVVYSGVTTSTLTINSSISMNGNSYRCVLSNSGSILYSSEVFLYVDNINPETPSLATLTGECSVTATAPTTTDNCAGTVTGTTTDPTTYTEQGNYTITWSFDDGNGNSIDVDQAVIIDDITLPVIFCVGNQSVSANENQVYIVDSTAFDPVELSDNCEVLSVTNDYNSRETLAEEQIPVGTTIISWEVTDNAGNRNSCSFEVVVKEYVGMEILQQKGISIYPNPTKGLIHIKTVDNNIKKISITNISGKQIFEKKQIRQNETIDLFGLGSGIYIICIRTDDEIFMAKIIVE